MSIKNDVDYIKEELNSEEKFLESFVKLERFYKKNKVIIIAAIVIIVGLVIGYYTTKYIQNSNKTEANIAFNKVLENPKDSQALETLKTKSDKLYQLALYLNAKDEGKTVDVNIKYLKEISTYQEALAKNDIAKLNSVSMQNDFLLKEFAIFNKALIQTENGKFEDAKATLKLIPADSKVNDLVKVLKHYLSTK